MRIAYHNPWVNSAENQTYMSMAEAAQRIGVELVACVDEKDIEACRPDFVMTVASSVAKITDFPTYLTVHEPKALFLEQPQRMRNLFSFDGYLTVSESLVGFIRDFCAGVGRWEDDPGFCYLTPQTSALRCDWDSPDLAARLRVVYFGTNWNRRMPLLFRALDPMGILRIQGPEASWAADGYASYAGPAAFDGIGPQRAYAECGIGLVLMDERWQREDVISNRVFEISSVGAVSICPDMPWTRKWFGDSVFYFDARRPMREIAEQVRTHHAFCRSNPGIARMMGQEARRIFETHFTAERLLSNAVAYHHRKTAERERLLAAMPPAPRISVVLRCGGRSIDFVRRAVSSIRRQTFGAFTVILAKYRDIDLSSIVADRGGAIAAFDEFLIEGGGRSEMLWAGLNRIASPYFAVLDDDDFWMSDHFEWLFRAGRRVDAEFDIAFSGRIDFDTPSAYNYGTQLAYRNIGLFGFRSKIVDAWHVAGAIGTNCFVARTDLLSGEMLVAPSMRTAEDSLLINLVSRRSKPIFSWRPTAFYRPSAADASNWKDDENRVGDELSFALRAGLMWSPRWLMDAAFEMPNLVWNAAKHKRGNAVMGEQMDRLTAGHAGATGPRGIGARPGVVGFVSEGPYAKLNPGRYVAIFLIAPSNPADAMPPNDATEPVGEAEVAVMAAGGGSLASGRFFRDDAELELRFVIDDTLLDWPIDMRVFSFGRAAFTVASICLHQDLTEPVVEAPPPVGEPEFVESSPVAEEPRVISQPIQVPDPGPSAELEALRAEIDALRRSTSWRVTAPIRRLVTLARGGRR
jgi:hypothetical protein